MLALQIKVCGMRNAANIKQLVQLPINYIGFIFYPKSPRYVGELIDPEIIQSIPQNIIKTGVFVNDSAKKIIETCKKNNLQAAQLHGDETSDTTGKIQNAGIITIKAFKVSTTFDFSLLEVYKHVCNYFLFDTFTINHGGSGKKFDWNVLKNVSIQKPFFLSGGIDINDVEEIKALNINNFYAIDLNSKFETQPGMKDISKLSTFINAIKNNK